MSIGYACQIAGSHGYGLQSCRLANATTEKLAEIIQHNLDTLEKMIEYNALKGIKLFRISSDIIPFATHAVNNIDWANIHVKQLARIGNHINSNGIRVSMHPGQYTVLNSTDEQVVQSAIADLEYHARFLDALETPASCKIVLHGGGLYGNKQEATQRFISNCMALPLEIKKRLTIENDEKCFNIEDILEISQKTSIPAVMDTLHHCINPPEEKDLTIYEWIDACAETWQNKDGIQKIHYSQQQIKGKPGAHSASIDIDIFMEFYRGLTQPDIDIMLEVKDKNMSALKCMYCTMESVPIRPLEKEWARYKYLIMERSNETYNDIRKMFGNAGQVTALELYRKIDSALQKDIEVGQAINAAEHVWGYVKGIATQEDRQRFEKLIDNFLTGRNDIRSLKKFLLILTLRQNDAYLLESYYFDQ